MSGYDKTHQMVEHLTLISAEVYLMTRAKDDAERLKRYNTIQNSIDGILMLIDDRKPSQYASPDTMLR